MVKSLLMILSLQAPGVSNMKILEILTEAQINPGIQKILTQKGYKFLGKGQDQDVYLAPDGTILKIFGYEGGSKGFSKSQQSFVDFANFCMNNPDNPFLPQFGGWETFEFKGQQYLQIKCERLFDFQKSNAGDIAIQLENLASEVQLNGAYMGYKAFMLYRYEIHGSDEQHIAIGSLIALLGGEDEVLFLCKTIEQLSDLARQKGYTFDLHRYNFMLGSDGEIVINDPFFTGAWRK